MIYIERMKNRISEIFNLSILMIILTFSTQCRKGQVSYNGIDFKKQKIYLFYRETASKAGMISKSYNIHHSNYSHVGIGLCTGNEIYVYHILNAEVNKQNLSKSDLIKETVKEFYSPKNDKVLGGEIFLVEGISKNGLLNFRKVIKNLEYKKLKFDKKFTTKNDDNFYCSELVYYILHKINVKFNIEQTHKKLTGIDKIILKRDSISYYPADVFIGKPWLKSLKKW